MPKALEPLIIADREISIPIVQGGMGVQVSTAALAGAVAECGAVGTIAGVGLGYGTEENETDFPGASRRALQAEIRKVKAMTKGFVGVNLLGALSNFEDLARTAAAAGADFIASGAGLPLCLPALTDGFQTRLIPIVSSARAAAIIIKAWKKRYDRVPDAFIVEGPLAGGHLGFKPEELQPPRPGRLEAEVVEVLKVARDCERQTGARVPVIAAGGIFDGKDAARFFALGARGVQIATRLVATKECSVAQAFKDLYLKARPEDLVIIESPVGMPGRAIRTRFVDRVLSGARVPFKCGYQCLRTCNPAAAPYCIAKAMFNAVAGDIDNAVVFAGHNVSRVREIVPVRDVLESMVREAEAELQSRGGAARPA
ncbi:MAG: nitronate monooxygenase family protein [Elusimicrobia bacterium]|nr:nitronate monooxygenase family protein [Elusimicrobiota bacterium]